MINHIGNINGIIDFLVVPISSFLLQPSFPHTCLSAHGIFVIAPYCLDAGTTAAIAPYRPCLYYCCNCSLPPLLYYYCKMLFLLVILLLLLGNLKVK